jgi:hypothetical protein
MYAGHRSDVTQPIKATKSSWGGMKPAHFPLAIETHPPATSQAPNANRPSSSQPFKGRAG